MGWKRALANVVYDLCEDLLNFFYKLGRLIWYFVLFAAALIYLENNTAIEPPVLMAMFLLGFLFIFIGIKKELYGRRRIWHSSR